MFFFIIIFMAVICDKIPPARGRQQNGYDSDIVSQNGEIGKKNETPIYIHTANGYNGYSSFRNYRQGTEDVYWTGFCLKYAMTSHRYGDIAGKYVIYRGEAAESDGIQYLNVEEYLKSLG